MPIVVLGPWPVWTTVSSGDLTCPHGGSNLPHVVLIEIRVRDPDGRAAVLLSSGVYLPGSGL